MKASDKISIIIPCYNSEKYIERTILSIIEQTYKNLEIIVVNDGSNDNSLKIIEQYTQKDDRIHIINKNNGGLSSARNSGINAASGKYIVFCDSDDTMDKDLIEVLHKNITIHQADIAMCSTKLYIDEIYQGICHPYWVKCCNTLTEKITILRGGGYGIKCITFLY